MLRLCVFTGKDSRSDPHGQSCAIASDLQSTLRVSQASGNTAGSFGLLPSPTRFFRKTPMLSCRTAARRAHLRSHSGRNAGVALAHAPTTPECTVAHLMFRVLLLERLHLPLPVTEAVCSCGTTLDPHGKHRAACSLNGWLKKRATPIERMVERIFREAGARVRFNALLQDMNVGIPSADERRIEVLAQDLPCCGGAQLAVDVTLRSPLRSTGEPHPNAADVNGAVLLQARRDKETTYPELVRSGRCSHQVALAWERRWTRMLATTCAISFAASLVEPSSRCESCPTPVGWHPQKKPQVRFLHQFSLHWILRRWDRCDQISSPVVPS